MADRPFNSLGQILSTGGEIALGLAYSLEKPPGFLLLLFDRRLRPATDDDRAALISLSRRGVSAAKHMQMMRPDEIIPMDEIPINPYLFDGGTDGRRILAVGDVSHDGGDTWFQKRVPLPDETTWGGLVDQLLGLLEKMKTWEPPYSKTIEPEDKVEPAIRMHFAERAY